MANEGQPIMWAEQGESSKNQGRGVMVSDFVSEYDGLLELSDNEYRRAAGSDPSVHICARK